MKITGEELFKIWMAWPETKNPFVIEYETWFGEKRYLNIIEMTPCKTCDSAYEIHCYTGKFRSVRHFVKKTDKFEITEPGRFFSEEW